LASGDAASRLFWLDLKLTINSQRWFDPFACVLWSRALAAGVESLLVFPEDRRNSRF
jgi:hypothetical protein